MGFANAKAKGSRGETRLIELLESFGLKCVLNKDYKKNAWDLTFLLGDKEIRVEVKNDLFAVLTSNIALEFFNPVSGKRSGLDLTAALLWVHMIPNRGVYINRVDKLRDFVCATPPYKTILNGGDGNSNFRLYHLSDIVGKGLFVLPQDNAEDALGLLTKLINNSH